MKILKIRCRDGAVGEPLVCPVLEKPEILDKLRGDKNLSGFDLSGFDFSGRDLSHANFDNSILVGCDFRKADLANAHFVNADITGILRDDKYSLVWKAAKGRQPRRPS